MEPLDLTDFLGKTKRDGYVINRQYIEGDGNQLRLYHTRYTPNQAPIASVCIVHGFGQYSGRYHHIAEYFISKKFEVLTVDLRGFGYSGGARACAEIDDLIKDVITIIKRANTELPLYVYGHSMGGLISVSLMINYPFLNLSGIILTSPFIGFPEGKQFNFVKTWFIKQMGLQLQDFVLNSQISPTSLTKNDKQMINIVGNRLMAPFLSVKKARSLVIAIERAFQNASSFKTPIIIFHGKKDSAANYKASVALFEKLGSIKKNIKLFENGYHELVHDEQCPQLLKTLDTWIQSVGGHPLTVLNLNKMKVKKPRINWKWLLVLIYFLIVLHSWKARKPNTSILRIIFSPLLLAFKSKQ